MIVFLSILAYVIVGTLFGKYMYNRLLDKEYENALKRYSSSPYNYKGDKLQERAYESAKDDEEPALFGIPSGFFWPLVIVGYICWKFLLLLGFLVGFLLPKSSMEKQRAAYLDKKNRIQEIEQTTKQLQEDIEVLKQVDIDTKEVEEIVRSNRIKLKSLRGS